MTGMFGYSRLAAGLLGAAVILAGCARSVEFDPGTTTGSGGSGDGGAGGAGATGGAGGSTTNTTISTGGGPPGSCTDDIDCTYLNGICSTGVCADGVCTALPANQFGTCDDGKFCTQGDACQNGQCVGSQQMACPGGDGCHVASCDEATQGCIVQVGNNGAQCDDGDSCTYFGTCSNGTCQKGPPINCTFLNGPCVTGVCDPATGCKTAPVNDGLACEDGLFCTQNDTCQAGTCTAGQPLQCAPASGCFISICDESTNMCTAIAGNDGAACDDGDACTVNTICASGACLNGVPSADGIACNDGSSCTTGEFCTAGLCGGGAGPTIYFAEDFHDNSKSWTLGQDWQIGPAMVSMPVQGFPDPGLDHSPGNDNGVAGVVIGGNAPTGLHPYYYLESPTFDTSTAAGPVILGFQRWLNSDYDPFMHNTIEVYNGSQWITIWTTGSFPGVTDSEWTFVQHDLTAYKGPAMRIRFGFDIGSSGVYTIGSWNIDDVLVASGACP